jgi:multicomponent K+:H+ antiporter subunit E
MRSFIPYPLLTLGLLLMWLVLNDSVDAGDVILGLLMGLVGGVVYARLEPPGAKPGKLVVPAATLIWLVVIDIIRSNIAVLQIVLGLAARRRVSGFLAIPLELRDPRGLAVLAGIVTATPGTSWAHFEAAANVLTLHVLDLVEPEEWVLTFKSKYERRLMEIFQ